MALLDKDTLISMGLGGVVGLGIGAIFLNKAEESSLFWCFVGGGVLAGAAKLAESRRDVGGLFLTGAGMSFEEAWSHASQSYDPAGSHVPDLTAEQLGRPFAGGSFLNACGVPMDMSVVIKAAVQNGRAIGVTVVTSPPNSRIAACIDSAVRRFSFPVNPNLDAVTQTF